MHRLYKPVDDFEALIHIYTEAEGGRVTAPFNGIRWDFSYVEGNGPDNFYMIWPDFFDSSGNSLPSSDPLPVGAEIQARMTIVVDEMRDKVHRLKIQPGVEFYCHEGPKRVAIGRVTRVTGLNLERESAT